jgi:hypothetical protein
VLCRVWVLAFAVRVGEHVARRVSGLHYVVSVPQPGAALYVTSRMLPQSLMPVPSSLSLTVCSRPIVGNRHRSHAPLGAELAGLVLRHAPMGWSDEDACDEGAAHYREGGCTMDAEPPLAKPVRVVCHLPSYGRMS